MKNSYDAIVIGMGPSGIFLAYELVQLKKAKNILLIDQGKLKTEIVHLRKLESV